MLVHATYCVLLVHGASITQYVPGCTTGSGGSSGVARGVLDCGTAVRDRYSEPTCRLASTRFFFQRAVKNMPRINGSVAVRRADDMIMRSSHDLPPGKVMFFVFRTVLKALLRRKLAFTPRARDVCVRLSEALAATSSAKKVSVHVQVLAADRAMREGAGDDFHAIARSAAEDLRGMSAAVMEKVTEEFGLLPSVLEVCAGVSKALLDMNRQDRSERVQLLAANRAMQQGAGTADLRAIARTAARDLSGVSAVVMREAKTMFRRLPPSSSLETCITVSGVMERLRQAGRPVQNPAHLARSVLHLPVHNPDTIRSYAESFATSAAAATALPASRPIRFHAESFATSAAAATALPASRPSWAHSAKSASKRKAADPAT